MGFNFRKSKNLGGGFRVNASKSGLGGSWGVKGFRVSKSAKGGVRTTVSIPGTGISYRSGGKGGSGGCIMLCIVWPFKLIWYMMLGCFWLMYGVIWLFFVFPIKGAIKLYKRKKFASQNAESE